MPLTKRTLQHSLLATLLLASPRLVSPALADMKLALPGLENQSFSKAQEFAGFGCTGQNLSPKLTWSGAPPETRSFIVTIYDPDAPTGSGLWHWSAFNIPPSVTELEEGTGRADGAAPLGAVFARNDFSNNQYDGACPPEGSTHHYVISVFAMPMEQLPLDATASSAMVGFFANTSSLAKASVVVTYGR